MARKYIEIGQGPAEESCAQVGSSGYDEIAPREAERSIHLIRDHLGTEPQGARLMVKRFPHEFGSYYETVCTYDEDNPEAMGYAMKCENEAPVRWRG